MFNIEKHGKSSQLIVYPANIKSSPELVFRRRKCDGGGYTVPQ